MYLVRFLFYSKFNVINSYRSLSVKQRLANWGAFTKKFQIQGFFFSSKFDLDFS